MRRIEVDVALTTFCDPGGLSGFFRARLAAQERGVSLYLVRVPPYLGRLLDTTGLRPLLYLRKDPP
ncbi:STAS domain-containing protein [Streptacidiphilus sp. EB103A]|uniref:STAS domain-containing protein n=1 Tax=Streptacidiphilus sp. EB103A TaxID=3156275 RepID=UPI0035118B02